MSRRQSAATESDVRLDVLKKFAATQMLAVHAARRSKRQRLQRATTNRMLRNVENVMRFQKAGMANRREAFVECIANMGTQAIDVLSRALELDPAPLSPATPIEPTMPTVREPFAASTAATEDCAFQAVDLSVLSDRLGSSNASSNSHRSTPQPTASSIIPSSPADHCVLPDSGITAGVSLAGLSVVLEAIPDAQFFDLFRMKRETFQHVYEELAPYLEGDAATAQLNMAIALWVLGGSEPQYAPLMLIPEEQRIECTLDFCRCVTKCLMPKVISIHERMESTMWNFQWKFGLRSCAGALNFTHIPVHLGDHLKDESCEYINQAGSRSIVMQAVVSSDYRFCDLSIGYPGRTPVDRVLYNSALWRKAESGILFPAPSGPNQGPHPYLIAGTCYPLSDKIVTPFVAPKFSDIEKRFNNSIYNALSVTQRAFKLLRSRFPYLLDLSGVSVEDAPCVAAACCALHNVCEARGEITKSSWEAKATSKQHHHLTMAQGQSALQHEPDPEAVQFREMVKNSMIHNYDRKF